MNRFCLIAGVALLCGLFSGCQSSQEDSGSEEPVQGFGDLMEIAELDAFWEDFAQAVQQMDSTSVLDLMLFPLEMATGTASSGENRTTFRLDVYSDLFGEEAFIGRISESTVRDLIQTESGYKLSLGDENDSAGPILHFSKVDALGFRLVRIDRPEDHVPSG